MGDRATVELHETGSVAWRHVSRVRYVRALAAAVVCLLAAPAASRAATIFSDTYPTTTFGSDYSGSSTLLLDATDVYSAPYAVHADGKGTHIVILTKPTQGYTNVVVSYWWAGYLLESSDTFTTDYTTNGVDWIVIHSMNGGTYPDGGVIGGPGGDSDGVYYLFQTNLAAAADNSDAFQLRFTLFNQNAPDHWYFDDLLLEGEPMGKKFWVRTTTDWNTGSNWTPPGEPTSTDELVIPSAAAAPTLIASEDCGAITITDGELVIESGGTLNVYSNFINESGGTLTMNGGTLAFRGALAQTYFNAGAATLYDLTVDKTAQTLLVASDAVLANDLSVASGAASLATVTVTVSNAVSIAGTLTAPAGTLTVGGAWTNDGTFANSAGTVVFNGATAIGGASVSDFHNVTITGSLTAPAGTLRIGGAWQNDGTFDHASGTIEFNDSATISGTSTSRLNHVTIAGILTAPAAVLEIAGAFTNNGTFNHGSGTVDFVGDTPVGGSAATTFNHVTLTGTLTAPAGTLGIDGNFANNGTFNHGSGTLEFGGDTTLSGAGAFAFNNVTIAAALTAPAGTVSVAGTWQNNGTFNPGGGTVDFNGAAAVTGSSPSTFHHVTISSALTAPGSALYVEGNFVNNGSFTHGSGTVVFQGSGVTTNLGSTTFHNLQCSTGGKTNVFDSAGTVTVNGTLTLAGSPGNMVVLRSTADGSPWALAVAGSASVSLVDVKDSNASGGSTIIAAASQNSGGNSNWIFRNAYYYIAAGGDWNTAANWASSSGGAGGAGVPGTNDAAFLDANSGHCTLDADAGCDSLNTSGYTNTLALGTYALQVIGGFTHAGGTVTIGESAGAGLEVGGALANSAVITCSGASALSCGGDWSNNGTFTPSTGTVTFNGITTISGVSTSSFHNVAISGTLTAPSGTIQVDGDWANDGTFNSGSGTVLFNGTSTIAGANATPFLYVTVPGTLTLGAADRLGDGSRLNVSGTFDLAGYSDAIQALTGAGAVTLGSGTLTITHGIGWTFSGEIGGSGGLVKQGAGQLTLAGANSYTGPTTVSGGTLNVTGSTSIGAVTVNAGAVLTGTGTLGGAVTVEGGATVSGGATNTLGTLNFSSTLALDGRCILNIPGATSCDLLSAAGAVSGTGSVDVVLLGGYTPDVTLYWTNVLGGAGSDYTSITNPITVGGEPNDNYTLQIEGDRLVLRHIGQPFVDNNGGASDVTAGSATLNGELLDEGRGAITISLFWGDDDAGTNAPDWDYEAVLGLTPLGAFSTNVTGLTTNTTYYYRSFASNATQMAWASSTTNFTTPGPGTIDGNLFDATDEFNTSPNVVFISDQVGYVFFVDQENDDPRYRKTTDGGATWQDEVSLGADENWANIAVWYDQWTPGDFGGTRIHIVAVEDKHDDVYYRYLDTSGDTLGAWQVVLDGFSYIPPDNGNVSITKALGGHLFCWVAENIGGTPRGMVARSINGGSTWTDIMGTAEGLTDGGDHGQLLPLDEGDVLLVLEDVSAGTLRSKVWDATTESWDASWADIAGWGADASFAAQWGAALDKYTGDIYLAGANDFNTASTDVAAYKYTQAARAWAALAPVSSNDADLHQAVMAIDENSGNLYAVYIRGPTAGTRGVYYKVSTDDGASWSGENGPISGGASDFRILRCNMMNRDRLFAVWYDEADALVGGTLVDLSRGPLVNVSGAVYAGEGSAPLANGKTVRLVLNALTPSWFTNGTTGGTGAYQISNIRCSNLDTLTVYLDNQPEQGTTVTLTDGATSLTGLDIYTNHVILRCDTTGALAITNMAAYDYDQDTDIAFTANGNTLTVLGADQELYVWTGDSFTPGGDVYTDDVQIQGTYTAGTNQNITVAGDWVNNGTFSPSTSTVTFSNVTAMSGTGTHAFNAVTVTGTLTAPAGTLNVAGNFVNDGIFSNNVGWILFSGSTVVSGLSTSSFHHVFIAGSLTAPAAELGVSGSWINSGTFNHGSGTVAFNGSTAMSGTSTSAFNNVVISGTVDAATALLAVAGAWQNNGTFNPGTGSVTFNGDTTVSGVSTSRFYHVAIAGILTAPAGELKVSGNWQNDGTFNNGSGTVVFDNTTTLGGANVSAFNAVRVTGNVTLGAADRLGDATILSVEGGILNLGGYADTVADVTLVSGQLNDGTLTASRFAVQSGSASAALAGSGPLGKSLTGSVTLSGNNTYSGATTISNGWLLVNGDTSGAGGSVGVQSGAGIGGTGTVGGATAVLGGATVSAGTINTVGTLAFGSTLTLDGQYKANISGTDTNDLLNVTGAATGAGSVDVDFIGGFTPVATTNWTLITGGASSDYSSITNNLTIEGGTDPRYALAVNGNDLILTYTGTEADLGILKFVNDSAPATNEVIQYTLVLTNIGPDTANSIQVTDDLPLGVSYHSHSNGTYNPVSGVWDVASLAAGDSTTLYLCARVDEGTQGIGITNTAAITASDAYDGNGANDAGEAGIVPTLVVLAGFDAALRDGRLVVRWKTAAEYGTIGFHLERLDPGTGTFKRVNPGLLPAVLTAPQGGVYTLVDEAAAPSSPHTYRLVEIERRGGTHTYGPFQVTAQSAEPGGEGGSEGGAESTSGDVLYPETSFTREANTASAETLARLEARAEETGPETEPGTGQAVRIKVDSAGLYRVGAVTVANLFGLSEAEVTGMIQGGLLRLSNRGVAVPYLPLTDGLLFYGVAPEGICTAQNVYRLERNPGPLMAEVSGAGGRATEDAGTPAPEYAIIPPAQDAFFTHTAHFEQNRYAATALFTDPGADFWLWDYFIAGYPPETTEVFNFELPGLATEAGAGGLRHVTLAVRFKGATESGVEGEHYAVLRVNGVPVGETRWSGFAEHEMTVPVSYDSLNAAPNVLEITADQAPGVAWSIFYLDSFDLTYQRRYEAVAERLLCRVEGRATVAVTGFAGPDIRVFDVTDAGWPVRVAGVSVTPAGDAYEVRFTPPNPDGVYYAVSDAGLSVASAIEADAASDLRAPGNTADYVVICPPAFAEAAETLAAYRQAQGMDARVVLTDDIYDEFNHGLAGPDAIRQFLAHAYGTWTRAPRFVLLAGKGTYDYKNFLGYDSCLVPPLMVKTPQQLHASDNRLADLDGDHVPDMAVGRLPVLTSDELLSAIAKIRAYEAGGAWRQAVVMLADNPDDGGHFDADSHALAGLVTPDYPVEKLHLPDLGAQAAHDLLLSRLNTGCGLVNYLGHAGLGNLATERVLTTADLAALQNGGNPPVLLAMSCTVGRFAIPGFDSLGEALTAKPDGGAVAVWAPVGLAWHAGNRTLDRLLFEQIFSERQPRLGAAILETFRRYAAAGGQPALIDTYALLGDPATLLREAESVRQWQQRHFSEAELLDPAISGDLADPDGDGLPNLLEYALNLDPRDGQPVRALTGRVRLLQEEGPPRNGVTVTFRRRKAAGAVAYSIELCDELAAALWQPAGEHVRELGRHDLDSLTEEVTVRVRQDDDTRPVFIRLRVTRLEP
ncbi:MAG: DUF11 domain-containing protein [Kiritimatiellae bacterium]|nr:DUF11 domain-containing protein [Kiritimatiellia bacterium]